MSVFGRNNSSIRVGDDGLLPIALQHDPAQRAVMDALDGQSAPEPGKTDPDVDLKKLRGKVALIDFWGTWCGPCRLLVPALKQLHAKYHTQGLEIVGIPTPRAK